MVKVVLLVELYSELCQPVRVQPIAGWVSVQRLLILCAAHGLSSPSHRSRLTSINSESALVIMLGVSIGLSEAVIIEPL